MPGMISTAVRGHVLVVSIQRESKRNAIDRSIADSLDAALSRVEDDSAIWAGVLTGTQTVFSAGSDLTAAGDYVTERGGEYGLIRRRRHKPLIAAVEGPALGGGLEMVLACDLVVASRTATFGLPEVRIGALPNCGALFRGPQTLPVNLAKEMIVTGEPIDADRAMQACFVNRLTEPGEALEVAVALAEQICRNAPLAVQASLSAVNALLRDVEDRGWAETQAAAESLSGTADLAEGVQAFLEKRPPRWTGS